MQTYAPDDAPRAAPALAAHCGRSAPGSALARPTCRRPPSPPSRTAPGMHHAPADAGRIAARRAPGRSMPACTGLPIRTSARPGTAPPDRPSCGLQMARGHRRHGKPPAGLRRAQRNHASGLRPWLSLPCYRLPSRPPSLRHCAPHGKPRHQGLAARRWLPRARLGRPRPCERPEQSQSGGQQVT
jgi:hypothetical protein